MNSDESSVRTLYTELLQAWNNRSAEEYAVRFQMGGNLVGFDGSVVNGRQDIQAHLSQIFSDHMTARYVWKIREVRFLSPEVALVRAVVGMIPPTKSELNPATNAIQSLVAVKRDSAWRIALFQNTPAQFHERPAEAQALTDELRELV